MRSLARLSFAVLTALVMSVCFSATHTAAASGIGRAPTIISDFGLNNPTLQGENVGVIDGFVPGPDSEPREYTVVIERVGWKRVGWKREVLTDKNGRFRVEVLPAVYTAFARPPFGSTAQIGQYAPFRVGAGEVKKIEVDPTSEYVYCTADGNRVIPLQETYSGNNTKGLHRPKYHSFSEKGDLRVVVEYCGKSYANDRKTYKSAVVSFDGFRIISDYAAFDPQSGRLKSWGNVGVVEHGERILREMVTADFSAKQVVLNLTGEEIPSIRGDGSIKSGRVTFNFKVNENGISLFNYKDFAKGLKLESPRHHSCLIVVDRSKESITFSGSASLTYSANPSQESIVSFTVALKGLDGKPSAAFSIKIPNKGYSESGTVSPGEIKVSALPKVEGQSLVGVYRRAGIRPR